MVVDLLQGKLIFVAPRLVHILNQAVRRDQMDRTPDQVRDPQRIRIWGNGLQEIRQVHTSLLFIIRTSF